MTQPKLSADFITRLEAVKGKRSRVVIEHIREHGYVTTEQLEQIYGYKHPPRAVKDVRDQGIPIEIIVLKQVMGEQSQPIALAIHPRSSMVESVGELLFQEALKRRCTSNVMASAQFVMEVLLSGSCK